MSKNITIQEGGVTKQLTVDKLKTNLVSSGTCLWVPEDEVQLTTKTITENGTYKAADDGYYGYSEVIVSGQGTATGTDGDGDEAVAYTDPGTGELVVDKVPSSIRVITPPTNPYGIYQDGQAISTDGMVVKAYLASGGEYGTVPNSEITLNPTQAHYDESTDTRGSGTATSELNTGMVQPIAYSGGASINQETAARIFTVEYSGTIAAYPSTSNIGLLFASSTETVGTVTTTSINRRTGETSTNTEDIRATGSYTYNGKTVYFAYQTISESGSQSITHGPINTINRAPGGTDAWTMIYGTREEEPAGSHQTINVSWPRPLNGKVLETTFEILVAPGYTPNGGEE